MATARNPLWGSPLFHPVLTVQHQLLMLLLVLLLAPSLANAADSLAFGQHLSGNQTLVSDQGLFELGFFTPGASKKRYLGIWYKNVQQRTYVWVANRDSPIPESDAVSAVLRVSDDGGASFALFANTSSTTPIWSSSASSPTANRRGGRNSTRLLLLDTGNLVLVDGASTSDPSAFLWQSFDHPTDTVLPGAKIGYNRTSGKSWALTSWKSSDDPATGAYTLQIDPTGTSQYFLVWNGSGVAGGGGGGPYWSTGVYDGRIFANIPEMTGMQEYGFTHSDPSDAATRYFSYFDREVGGVSGMFVDTSGLLKWQKWIFDTDQWQVFTRMPKDPCLVPSHCGAFGLCFSSAYPPCTCLQGFERRSPAAWAAEDYTAGCVRRAPLSCGGGAAAATGRDVFLTIDAVPSLSPDPNQTTLLNNIASRGEGEGACFSDCSCTAFAFNGTDCRIWTGELMNLKQAQQQQGGGGVQGSSTLHLRVASSDLKPDAPGAPAGSSSNKKNHKKLVIGLISGLLALLLLSILIAWLCSRSRPSYGKSSLLGTQGFMPYCYKDIQKATSNFSEVLGKGGFGSVYKGMLPDNTPVAVKKLEPGLGAAHGDKQFRSEVSTMATIQHINILQLRGVCCQGPHRILVYDYMPKRKFSK